MIELRVDPVDVLYLRGNRLFAEANHAESIMPPWPSVFAGALRSDLLVRNGATHAFLTGNLGDWLGALIGRSPESLGEFRVVWSGLLLRRGDGWTWLAPAPADVVAFSTPPHFHIDVLRLQVQPVAELGVMGSFATSHALILRRQHPGKPLRRGSLTARGMTAWLRGETPPSDEWRAAEELWSRDPRLGIALDPVRRTVEEAHLYTTTTISLRPDVAFGVVVRTGSSREPAGPWTKQVVRLGGDARAAHIEPWRFGPETPRPWTTLPNVGERGRLTVVTASPCVFPDGWLPPGCSSDGAKGPIIWSYGSVKARLVAAALPGYEVVSGWDLAAHEPKPAQRAVPAGTVYYFDHVEGNVDDLRPILEHGLWDSANTPPTQGIDAQRWAAGFNAVWLGCW